MFFKKPTIIHDGKTKFEATIFQASVQILAAHHITEPLSAHTGFVKGKQGSGEQIKAKTRLTEGGIGFNKRWRKALE